MRSTAPHLRVPLPYKASDSTSCSALVQSSSRSFPESEFWHGWKGEELCGEGVSLPLAAAITVATCRLRDSGLTPGGCRAPHRTAQSFSLVGGEPPLSSRQMRSKDSVRGVRSCPAVRPECLASGREDQYGDEK